MTRTRRTVLALLAAQAGACVRFKRYEPAPLPSVGPAAYAGRRLDDSALTRFLVERGAPTATPSWDAYRLALTALFFRGEMTEARSEADEARAGVATAGARPPVAVGADVGRAARPELGNGNSWTVSLEAGLTFETGGKRAARRARARDLALAGDLRVAATRWQLVGQTVAAAAAVIAADSELAHAQAEVRALRLLRELLGARYAEGQLSESELARTETDVQMAAVDLATARRARTEARLALARALAVPLGQIDTLAVASADRGPCDALDSLPADSLQVRALRTRDAVGVALAEFAAADADVHLEVARQYPDIALGPSLAWDQGILRWLIALTLPDIALARDRGAIAEAEARRAQRAARVGLVQDSVLAAVDAAVAACRDGRADVAAADSLVAATHHAAEIARAAYGRGESGRTEVAFAEVARVRADRTRAQAVARRQAAGAALESAIGQWIPSPPPGWPDGLSLPGAAAPAEANP